MEQVSKSLSFYCTYDVLDERNDAVSDTALITEAVPWMLMKLWIIIIIKCNPK